MSNFSKNHIDRLARRRYFLSESLISFYKSFLHDRHYPLFFRYYLFFRLNAFIFRTNAYVTKIRNRCLITGRSRGVYRFFKMCRFSIRDLTYVKHLNGIYSRNW